MRGLGEKCAVTGVLSSTYPFHRRSQHHWKLKQQVKYAALTIRYTNNSSYLQEQAINQAEDAFHSPLAHQVTVAVVWIEEQHHCIFCPMTIVRSMNRISFC